MGWIGLTTLAAYDTARVPPTIKTSFTREFDFPSFYSVVVESKEKRKRGEQ
jgi:hypothetical protein